MRRAASLPSPVARHGFLAAAAALCVVALAACSDDGRSMREAGPNQTASIITTTTTLAPSDSDVLDPGALPSIGISVESSTTGVADTGAAETTASTSVGVVDSGPLTGFSVSGPWADGAAIDARYTCTGENAVPTLQWANVPPDAAELAIVVVDPDAQNFVHWVVAGIPPGVTGIADGQLPAGAVQGLNSAGTLGWTGPCPPAGESHTYRFEVHALSGPSGLTDGAVGDGMLRVIDGVSLEFALTIGVFPGS